jgi:hypothetical protein
VKWVVCHQVTGHTASRYKPATHLKWMAGIPDSYYRHGIIDYRLGHGIFCVRPSAGTSSLNKLRRELQRSLKSNPVLGFIDPNWAGHEQSFVASEVAEDVWLFCLPSVSKVQLLKYSSH